MSDDGGQAAAQYLGRTIGGRFQLQSLLGAGGMASVYLAYDSVLDRQVAVKTLHTELGREQSFRERFRREAQSVAKLTHTNIVSVFDSGEDEIDGAMVPYIVMEYVEGKPLRNALDEDIAQYGAMPTEKALKITADVLAALEVSHEMGLVHRDIKPGNVMVTRRGVVKVMDFGIARAMQSGVTSMTQTGMVVGTPQYLSPEQALGRGVDARSDLYSVGILLFELLTGRLPFDADSPLAIAYAHVQEEAPQPSAINQAIPPAVDALVARTLRKNPNERFPTAEAMHDECRRIGGSGATSGMAPHIVHSAVPTQSGAGVGQAVFPPVNNAGTPPPHPVQQPYPAQYGFGPSTPPPQQNAPGQFGGQTPPPGPYGNAQQTPPPYGLPPQGGQGPGNNNRGKNNLPLIIGSSAAAIIAVLVLIVVLTNNSPHDPPRAQRKAAKSTSDPADKFKPEDKSQTIEKSECTTENDIADSKHKVRAPDFGHGTNLYSVKKCIRAAGWMFDGVKKQNENIWGKNAVIGQDPEPGDDFDPSKDSFTLTVSTGHPDD